MVSALSAGLIVRSAEFGETTIDNLDTLSPNMAGNIVALSSFSFAESLGLGAASPPHPLGACSPSAA